MVRLEEFICNYVQSRKVAILLGVIPLYHAEHGLGTPMHENGLPVFVADGRTERRRLAAISVMRPVTPATQASSAPAAITLARPAAGMLHWLPGARRLAALLEPRFVLRVAHVFEIDLRYPRLTSALAYVASCAHATLVGVDVGEAPAAHGH